MHNCLMTFKQDKRIVSVIHFNQKAKCDSSQPENCITLTIDSLPAPALYIQHPFLLLLLSLSLFVIVAIQASIKAAAVVVS